MNPQPDPTAKFLVGMIANALRIFLTPFYYAGRSDMGIQWTAITPVLVPAIVYGIAGGWLSIRSDANAMVIELNALLLALGFVRNTIQARRRRQLRDWNVHSWSTGRTLLEPLTMLFCRAALSHWGRVQWVRRMVGKMSTGDFVYYVAEPSMLVLGAGALWSIGATVWFYPIILSVALIAERSDMQLSLYLKAHEVMDGKKLELAIKGALENPTSEGRRSLPIAQIPEASTRPASAHNENVFERLSPDLQILLARDRAAHS